MRQNLANSGTLTGSIGVIMTSLSRMLENRLGIGIDGYRTLESAKTLPLESDEREEYLNASIDRIYADFISKAAAGREMEVKDPGSAGEANGRAAKERNLIDAIGGYEAAIQETLARAGATEDTASFLYPRPKPPEEFLPSLQNVEMSVSAITTDTDGDPYYLSRSKSTHAANQSRLRGPGLPCNRDSLGHSASKRP